jgi:hypothetical protein
MDALTSIDWDSLFGYVVQDYCLLSILCAVALTAVATFVRLGTRRESDNPNS